MLKILGLSAVFALSAFSAQASSLSLQELITEFNGISKGDWQAQSHTQGRGYVGGNLSNGATSFGSRADLLAPSVGGGNTLVVKGSVGNQVKSFSGENVVIGGAMSDHLEVQNGGDGYIGGAYSGHNNFGNNHSNQSVQGAAFADRFPEIDFSEIDHAVQSLGAMGGYTARDSEPAEKKTLHFDTAPASGGISVYNVSFADLASANNTFFVDDLGGADQIIVNVSGDAALSSFSAHHAGLFGGEAEKRSIASSILWNFYEFTGQLDIMTNVLGTVIAPFAQVHVNSDIDGSLLAASIRQHNGQLHIANFSGDLGDLTATTPVPLPAGLPLLLAGLGGLGIAARRKRR
ncbi:collagen-binding domain-containing protein [Qingshengfaniella alkalisoli]|uniref:VPLPA-CTERM sorting domain-containing protein n=1 Tax=Qingshengfaniella alkalisoli TaxID=2599296 RepID=A0A5B8I8F0_9RHOB|nr:collagen-binding domain-containing protein [Qingshengfaniella alkalisoli]QDY70255.1 VPLPA-CTERM sorting domain-containing protein [Qingshengfaniella alkalisoli]